MRVNQEIHVLCYISPLILHTGTLVQKNMLYAKILHFKVKIEGRYDFLCMQKSSQSISAIYI